MPTRVNELKEVNTMAELNAAATRLIDDLVKPFVPKGKSKAEISSQYWNNELDCLSKTRSRLYHRMKRTIHPRDIDIYKNINHKIKRKYKKLRKATFLVYCKRFNAKNQSEASRQLSRLIKAKKRNRTSQGLEKFTDFVSTKFPPSPTDARVKPHQFLISAKKEELIDRAARTAPRNKAEGLDNTSGELFSINPAATSPAFI